MKGYTYSKDDHYGWNVYRDGVWIAWTAGSRADAKEMAADIERTRSAS